MMISCEKAAHLCSKDQYKETSWSEKLKLRMHLAICKQCTRFAKKNKRLSALFKSSGMVHLAETDRAQMKEQLKKQG